MKKMITVLLATAAATMATGAAAQVTYSGSATGPISGATYTTFNTNVLGSTPQSAGSGILVTFTGSGAFVNGSVAGQYAAPYVYGSTGANFGAQPVGPDTTNYVSSGIGTATLTFATPQSYIGMLLGSVDTYNTLSFFSGTTLIESITGSDIMAAMGSGNAVNSTLYVNFMSSIPFTSIEAKSTMFAFEFDNVATSVASAVPEAATWAMMMVGLGVVGGSLRRRRTVNTRVSFA